jgi:hypothetical protein
MKREVLEKKKKIKEENIKRTNTRKFHIGRV